MWRAARTAAVVALVAAAAPFVRAEAAPTSARWRLWRITRVGAAARPVGIDVAVTGTAPGALALLVGVSGTGTSRRAVSAMFWEDGGTGRAVYRGGTATVLCPAGTCPPGGAGAVQFSTGTDRPVKHEYLLLAWGADARTAFDRDRPGWRIREVAAPPVQRIKSVPTRATGATVGGSTLEHYEGTSASGGPRGSLAWASLPCDGGGYGEAQLGATPAVPDAPRTLKCLTNSDTDTAAIAARGVRWTVAGRVVGVSYQAPITRLLVLDLPK